MISTVGQRELIDLRKVRFEFFLGPAQAVSHLNNLKPVALFVEHGKRSRLAFQPTEGSGIYHAQ